MLRPDDLAQAPLAELVEHVIGADRQFVGVAGQELIDLIDRQPTFLDERFGEGTGVTTPALREVRQLRKLLGRQQPMLPQRVHQAPLEEITISACSPKSVQGDPKRMRGGKNLVPGAGTAGTRLGWGSLSRKIG